MILAFDTATRYCSVAVFDQGEFYELADASPNGHAQQLMPMIDQVLAQAGATIDQVDDIVVSLGPGSFTGLRIGIATALGLASALERPIHGVSALRARSYLPGKTICPIIDARRDRIYGACFGELEIDEANLDFTDFVRQLNHQGVVFTGEDIAGFAERAGATVVDNTAYARGAILAYQAGHYSDDIQPRYLRASQAEAEALGQPSP